MQFSKLANYFQILEEQDSRLAMTATLAKLFKEVAAKEIDKVCYLTLGILAPKYQGIEFNMAEKTVIKSIAFTLGKTSQEVERAVKEMGDLGDYLYQAKKAKNKIDLSVGEVYENLLKIAQDSGIGSVERKVNKLSKLLKDLDLLGSKYVVRIVINKLRLGFSDMTILDALSWFKKENKSLRTPLEKAFNIQADIGQIAQLFKKGGIKEIDKIKPIPGVPIRAAKAERLKDAADILVKLEGQCLLESKYDGFRIMLHLNKSKKEKLKNGNLSLFDESTKNKSFVRIFSRAMDSMTHMFPDLVEALRNLKAQSLIIDGEAIAVNPKTGKFLPFQETVQRKRKHGVIKKAKEIPLKVFTFDLLYLNGESLLEKPFIERRRQLEQLLKKSQSNIILLTEQKKVTKVKEFKEFFEQVESDGLEGLMAKKANTTYKAGIRDHNWVKYKVAMQSELADTIDCVVMGYYKGKGKRSKFGIGAFLVGIVSKDKILTVSKIGTGLTDDQWREMFNRCQKIKTQKKPDSFKLDKNLNPDVWCQPELVVEIEADTITKSPLHSAGLALRFPRLKRFRDDKTVSQATNLKELEQMY